MLSLACECSGRRCLNVVKWATPGVIIAILPKCPLCIAAYIALGTGIGISVSTAAYVRMGLLTLSMAALLVLGVRSVRGWMVDR